MAKFPKDYSATDVAGKNAVFEIKINKIQEKLLPELNAEFLKKTGAESLDTLRESIRIELEKQEQERAKNEAYNKAIDTLIKNNPFEVPPSKLERYFDLVLEDAKKYGSSGIPAPSREEIAEQYRDTGTATLKRYRIVDFIAEKEKIKATQEEVDEQIRKIAQHYSQPFEEVKQELRKNGTTNRIRSDIRERKTLDFLIGELETTESEE
jgi:trigger factor